MDRAYGARVVQVEPRFAEDAPLGYPTDGSSTGGQLATVPKAPWYNAVTEEIRNAIVGGGLVPDKNDLTQLNQSIEARLTRLEQAISGRVDQVAGKVDKFETIPSGFVMYSACLTNNPSWLLCDGRAVSRAAYANLFRAIGTTWGAGNGSTTFNVPYLLERVAWGSNGGIGQYIDSGAPDAWGEFGGFESNDGVVATGAFYKAWKGAVGVGKSDSDNWVIGMRLSRCSPVYGRTNHIQPPASRLAPYIHV